MLINRDTDDTQSLDAMQSLNTYLPGTVPTDFDARNRFLNYKRDPQYAENTRSVEFHRRAAHRDAARSCLGNSTGILEKFVGGWQIAGVGNTVQGWWSLPTDLLSDRAIRSNITASSTRSRTAPAAAASRATCTYNGYIPANRINSVDANGKPNGIEGVPANYKPSAAPLIPQGQTALPANAPAGTNVSQFWDTNNVWIPLKNGTVQRVVYNDNLNPWRNQYVPRPGSGSRMLRRSNSSSIKERASLRFNVDFFNVFNHPNNPTAVATTGILSTRNSGSGGEDDTTGRALPVVTMRKTLYAALSSWVGSRCRSWPRSRSRMSARLRFGSCGAAGR